jgi:prepilin-type N-terminal cleavage/methylation domain-containing protein
MRLRKSQLNNKKGFTLVEVLVSMAMIAIISIVVVGAFTAAANIRNSDTTSRNEAQQVEANIATGAMPTATDERDLVIGDSTTGIFELPSDNETYTSGRKSYNLINPGEGKKPLPMELDGDEYYTATYEVVRTGKYQLEVWGAQGGGRTDTANLGGKGGYSKGVVILQKGDTLYLNAGQKGVFYYGQVSSQVYEGTFGGGGGVDTDGSDSSGGGGGTSGGGASDVRINNDNLYSRVIVSGGGGGAGLRSASPRGANTPGGYGGGATGGAGTSVAGWVGWTYGLGAGQSAGGALAAGTNSKYHTYVAAAGTFGNGGIGVGNSQGGGGGGGGWYGGGGGNINSGGGGSGWVFTAASMGAWTNATDKNNYTLKDQIGYYMTETQLVAGNSFMPDPRNDDTPITGMSGNGYVRISYLGR